jgi:hypothetical protein
MDFTDFLKGFSAQELKDSNITIPAAEVAKEVAAKPKAKVAKPKAKAVPEKAAPLKVIDLTEKTTAQVFREANPWQEPTKRQQQGQRFTTCLKV